MPKGLYCSCQCQRGNSTGYLLVLGGGSFVLGGVHSNWFYQFMYYYRAARYREDWAGGLTRIGKPISPLWQHLTMLEGMEILLWAFSNM